MDVVLHISATRIKIVLKKIIQFLKESNIFHLLLAFVSDNCQINEKEVDPEVPRLWDYSHLKKNYEDSHTEVILGDLYAKPILKTNFETISKKYYDYIKTNTPPLLTKIIEKQATQLLKAASRFFVVAPDVQIQACYLKSDVLESFGQKWKNGLVLP